MESHPEETNRLFVNEISNYFENFTYDFSEDEIQYTEIYDFYYLSSLLYAVLPNVYATHKIKGKLKMYYKMMFVKRDLYIQKYITNQNRQCDGIVAIENYYNAEFFSSLEYLPEKIMLNTKQMAAQWNTIEEIQIKNVVKKYQLSKPDMMEEILKLTNKVYSHIKTFSFLSMFGKRNIDYSFEDQPLKDNAYCLEFVRKVKERENTMGYYKMYNYASGKVLISGFMQVREYITHLIEYINSDANFTLIRIENMFTNSDLKPSDYKDFVLNLYHVPTKLFYELQIVEFHWDQIKTFDSKFFTTHLYSAYYLGLNDKTKSEWITSMKRQKYIERITNNFLEVEDKLLAACYDQERNQYIVGGTEESVVCISALDNSVTWKLELGTPVWTIAYDHINSIYVVGGGDKVVYFIEQNKIVHQVKLKGVVKTCGFDEFNGTYFVGGEDNHFTILSAKIGETISTINLDGYIFTSGYDIKNNVYFAGGQNFSMYFIDASNVSDLKIKHQFKLDSEINASAYDVRNDRYVVACDDCSLNFISADDYTLQQSIALEKEINVCGYDISNNAYFAGGEDKKLTFISAENYAIRGTNEMPDSIYCAGWDSRNHTYFVGCDKRLTWITPKKFTSLKTVEFDAKIQFIGYDQVNQRFFSGGDDNRVTWFSVEDYALIHMLDFGRSVKTGGYNPDNDKYFVGGEDRKINFINGSDFEIVHEIQFDSYLFTSGYDEVNRIYYTGGNNLKMTYIDQQYTVQCTLKFKSYLHSSGYDRLNNLYFAGGQDCSISFINAADFTVLKIIKFQSPVNVIRHSHTSNFYYVLCADCKVYMLNSEYEVLCISKCDSNRQMVLDERVNKLYVGCTILNGFNLQQIDMFDFEVFNKFGPKVVSHTLANELEFYKIINEGEHYDKYNIEFDNENEKNGNEEMPGKHNHEYELEQEQEEQEQEQGFD